MPTRGGLSLQDLIGSSSDEHDPFVVLSLRLRAIALLLLGADHHQHRSCSQTGGCMGTRHPANRPPAPMGEGPAASTTPVLPCLRAGSGQSQRAAAIPPQRDPLQDPGALPATSLTCLLPGDTSVRPPVGCVAGQRDVLLQSERDLAGTCPVQTPALSPRGPEHAWKRSFQLLQGSGPHGAALA